MIYFIDGRGGLIKIGYTAKLNQRLADFRTTLPDLILIGTMEGTRGHERTIHDSLANHRHEREWFYDCPEVRSFIARAIADGVREWKSSRRRNFEPSMWDHRADRLCEIICSGRPKSELALIEKEFSIPSGVLWGFRYRKSREVSVGEYFALLTAARESVRRRRERLDRADAFIADLEREETKTVNETLEAERRFAAVRAARALLGES